MGTLRARVRFYEPPDWLPGLAEFFDGLAQSWRGWAGERTWRSLEDQVALSATHDGLGHIALTVELHDDRYGARPGWRASGDLELEAGALEALAREAAGFEAAVRPAG